MKSIGIDPSLTATGWAGYDDCTGQMTESAILATPAQMLFIDRYKTLRDQIRRRLAEKADWVVGVESPTFGQSFSSGAYGLYLFVLEAAQSAKKDVVCFDPKTVKMLAKKDPKSHPGTMTKGDMVKAAKKELGLGKTKLNHNIADAYHIAKAAARFWQFYHGLIGESELTPAEWQAFAKSHTFSKGKKAGVTEHTGAVYKENERFFRFSKN